MRFEACLIAALLTAALVCPQPAGDPAAASFRAAWFVLLVGGIAAAVASISAAGDETLTPAPAFGAFAVWFAPLAVFVAQGRVWSILVAAFIGIAGARLAACFGDELPAPRRQYLSSAAALAMMAAFAAHALGRTAAAALLAGAASFTVTCLAAPDARPQPRARLRVKFAAQALAAILVAAAGLVRLPAPAKAGTKAGPASSEGGGGGIVRDDLLAGAILLASPPRHVKLTVPMPRRGPPSPAGRAAPPSVIEFSGAYWIYPYSMVQPPKSSMIVRATPVAYNFTAIDRTALRMRARQPLGRPVDSRCCSAIEVVVRNEDQIPDSIALALSLRSSTQPNGPHVPLGVQHLPPSKTAAVRFPAPARPVIPQFDEIVVDFELAGRRQHRSANVAIEKFVLVPRRR